MAVFFAWEEAGTGAFFLLRQRFSCIIETSYKGCTKEVLE